MHALNKHMHALNKHMHALTCMHVLTTFIQHGMHVNACTLYHYMQITSPTLCMLHVMINMHVTSVLYVMTHVHITNNTPWQKQQHSLAKHSFHFVLSSLAIH